MALFKKIFANSLVKLSSLNTLNIGIRILAGLISSKMIALFIGPGGMALTGSLRNFLSSVDAFSMLGMQNGIIKYTAEYERQRENLYKSLATSFLVVGVAVVICLLVLVGPAAYLSQWVFNGTDEYAWVFRILGIALPFYTGGILFMSVLNGLGRYKKVILLNLAANIGGVALSAILIWQYNIKGAFLGLILSPVILCFFSFYPLYRLLGGFHFLHKKYFSIPILKSLASYSLMALFTAIMAPFVFISIRNMIIDNHGADEAGYWEAVNRISVFYLMFVTTLLTVYFLPQLSKGTTIQHTKSIFRSYYKIIVPVFGAGLVAVYLLRYFIIGLLFSDNFLPMHKLFAWQLAGDFFKVCSLILGQEFFAKKMIKAYLATEVFSFAILYTGCALLIPDYGSEGAVMAHMFTYFVYFVVLAFIFRKKLF
ncbi:O-antigen translocase [Flavobacterium rhizosphaerae]|uniref:O-antigen translocase n=1 Tax=Flavobacterium rhizosphaerae TaxID=3163298 RepID=A0ABW8Z2I2_9FLAO